MLSTIKRHAPKWLDPGLSVLMLLSVAILMVALLSWQGPLGGQIKLDPGDVAPFVIVSPSRITYESALKTEEARGLAASAIPDQYDSVQGSVRRQQVNRAYEVLDFISIVRKDPHATPELQTDYLLAVNDLELTTEAVTNILSLSDPQWSQVMAETPAALDRAMREDITPDTLSRSRNRVSALITTNLDEEEAEVAESLVAALMQPNSFFNAERTETLRAAAREAVPAQTSTVEAGEVIVRAGDIADELAVEALTQIGLVEEQQDWWTVARAALFTIALLVLALGLLYRLRPSMLRDLQEQAIAVVLLVIWLLGAKFMVVPHDWLPYLYPLAAFAMLLTVLIDLRVAVIFTLFMMLFIHYLGHSGAALIVYLGVGALIGAVILGRVERLTAFLWTAVVVVASNLVVISAYNAPFSGMNTQSMVQMGLMIALNGGLAASIALIGYFIIGNLFGITTSLQLTELSRPTHPLLRQLLLKSPGTYHHTIVVSNMAERAAAAIGADAFLTRVGAYYHDIGKTVRPYFFTENIADGVAPHDKLDPYTSAQIIISHVTDGLELAERYHLPPRIRDFIREHHGRSLVKYFYIKAVQQAAEGEVVNEEDFRYHGPNPRSKETAILMLADTCEAAVRAVRPPNRDALAALVSKLIDERVANGELDESDLTFRELQITKSVFLRVLEGVNHPRISYPEPIKPPARPDTPAPAEDNGSPPAPADETPTEKLAEHDVAIVVGHMATGPMGGAEQYAEEPGRGVRS